MTTLHPEPLDHVPDAGGQIPVRTRISVTDRLPLALLATVLVLCASPQAVAGEKDESDLSQMQSITVLSDMRDRIFGTRLSGLFMKPTETFNTDWHTNDVVAATVTGSLAGSGRRTDVVPMDRLQRPQSVDFDSIDQVFTELSRQLSLADPQSGADLHLILLHVPVDPVPRPVTGARLRMFGEGVIGLAWEAGTKYRPSYVVRVNSGLNAKAYGKAQCIVVYSLAAVDAHTHEVVRKFHPRWVEHPLPDDFWIEDFESLPPERKELLRESCIAGLTDALVRDLRKLGLR